MLNKTLHIFIVLILGGYALTGLKAQQMLNLQECRELAIQNNKTLKKATEQERKADYEKKEALMQYFPKFSVSGTYMHFSDNLHLIQRNKIPGSIPLPPIGQLPLPSEIQIPPSMQDDIYKAAEIDMSNFWVLGVSLTQPIFAGGKIIALNDIRSYAKQLATTMKESTMSDVIVEIDEAYWQVISLTHKKKLADSYVELLSKMDSDTENMFIEGVATKADRLSVNVKLNEAEITLTKVENGLSLTKMKLCQIMGLDITDNLTLYDEGQESLMSSDAENELYNIESAIDSRSEIRSLGIAMDIYKAQERIALAEFLPTAGISAGQTWMNPNLEDGVQKKFGGMWNVAVNVKIPLNFVSSTYKLKAAKSETYMRQYELEDARDKVRLQINQSSYKLNEARKKLVATSKNSEKADENLRYANVGYEEGVIPTSDVLSAHTAWISAHAEMIDAQIDMKLCKLYLDKALGRDINN